MASIPTVHERTIKVLIEKFFDKHRTKLRSINKDNFKDIADEFLNSSNVLFDISTCKCRDISKCACPKEKKIPKAEHAFLVDQRNARSMSIGGIDLAMTKKNIEKQKRQEYFSPTANSPPLSVTPRTRGRPRGRARGMARGIIPEDENLAVPGPSTLNAETMASECFSQEESLGHPSSPIATPTTSRGQSRERTITTARRRLASEDSFTAEPSSSSQCRLDLSAIVQESDRYMVSDRATAAIATATLQSVNLVSEEQTANIIDKSKIRRDRRKLHTRLQHEQQSDTLNSIYFDGKIDKTKVLVPKMGKMYPDEKK